MFLILFCVIFKVETSSVFSKKQKNISVEDKLFASSFYFIIYIAQLYKEASLNPYVCLFGAVGPYCLDQ